MHSSKASEPPCLRGTRPPPVCPGATPPRLRAGPVAPVAWQSTESVTQATTGDHMGAAVRGGWVRRRCAAEGYESMGWGSWREQSGAGNKEQRGVGEGAGMQGGRATRRPGRHGMFAAAAATDDAAWGWRTSCTPQRAPARLAQATGTGISVRHGRGHGRPLPAPRSSSSSWGPHAAEVDRGGERSVGSSDET